jgi:hypothetical protein
MKRTQIMIVLCILFASSAATYASTLADYRERIESAQRTVETMSSAVQGASGTEYDDYLKRAESQVKHSIPQTEKVEIGGTVIETSNGWIRDGFDQFDKAATSDEQVKILSSLSERLTAISQRLKEIDTNSASSRSKDGDKQKLAEILRREEYRKPDKAEESLFQRIYRQVIEWLANLFPKPNFSPINPSGLQPLSVILQFLIYAGVIALVGFLIYKFAPAIAERFRRRSSKAATSRVILGEHISDQVSASDLFSEAESLARQGDYRAAIRKGYIALLCDLSDKKIIGIARHKTNRDYLRDLRKRRPLFESVKRATGSFERHWYGFRRAAPADWNEFVEHYHSAAKERSA